MGKGSNPPGNLFLGGLEPMQDIAFCADVFRYPGTTPYSERTLACLLWALVYANEAYLQGSGGNAPALYESGIHWEAEKPQGRTACPEGDGQELFLGIRQVLAQGFADCEDIAAWRCAELRCGRVPPQKGLPPFPGHPRTTACRMPYELRVADGGVDVLPGFFSRQTGPHHITIHIVVCWPDGFIEDPSRVLGMGGERRYG